MASFSKEIPLKYKKLDYEGVRKNYNWIKNVISEQFENVKEPELKISFYIGDISCSCESIKEFSEHAYGQSISVYSYNLSFYKSNSDNNYIKLTYIIITTFDKTLTVNCDNKEFLTKICDALEESMKQNYTDLSVQPQINNYIHDESTHINIGDNNTIQDTNIGKDNMVQTNNSASKEPFFKSVLQILVANWLWFILGFILFIIFGYLGINNEEWINFF